MKLFGYSLIGEKIITRDVLRSLSDLGIQDIGVTPSLLGLYSNGSDKSHLLDVKNLIEDSGLQISFIQGLTYGWNPSDESSKDWLKERIDKLASINELMPLRRIFVGAPSLRSNSDLWHFFLRLAKEYSTSNFEFSFENICGYDGKTLLHQAPFGEDTLSFDFPMILDVANHLDCSMNAQHAWIEQVDFSYSHVSYKNHKLPLNLHEAKEITGTLKSAKFEGLSFFESMDAFDFKGFYSSLIFLEENEL